MNALHKVSSARIKTITPAFRIRAQKRTSSSDELLNYEPPFVANAEKEIIKNLGIQSDRCLQFAKLTLHQYCIEAIKNGNFDLANKIASSPVYRSNDYCIPPIVLNNIHKAVMELYEPADLRGKKILQIASNWGPYMYFLKDIYKADTFGLDINAAAVAYAARGGLKFYVGDASRMGFRSGSFDIVISNNFLDYSYLNSLPASRAPNFVEKVIIEAHRILKPGGRFFSYQESEIENTTEAIALFGSFEKMIFPWSPVHILQKSDA